MRGQQGSTRSCSPSPSKEKPQSTTPPTAPAQFTFINQHSDIRSVRDRRIQNPDHRHEIRSHVMRNVRLTEHNQGRKRRTGRAPRRAKSRDRSRSIAGSPNTSLGQANDSTVVKRESPTLEELIHADYNMLVRTNSHPTAPLYASPGSNYYFDPFGQAPGQTLSHAATDGLLKYCFTHFMPMTFPVESKQTNEQLARRTLVLQAKVSNAATFSGFLATIACHRAVLFGKHRDLSPSSPHNSDRITDSDFKRAHHDALVATRTKVDKKEVSDTDFLEACFALISTTTILGNFREARTHLEGVQSVLNRVGIPASAAAWLPLADIKAALGMLTEPKVELPWPRSEGDQAVIARMLPPPNSPLSRMGEHFASVNGLSMPLRQLIRDAAMVCHMCDFNARDREGLTEQEHVIFRCKSLEVEHDLLKYVYEYFSNKNQKPVTPAIPKTEEVVRLAILGILSTISVAVLPGCGLGRAITANQKAAIEDWFTTYPSGPGQINPDIMTLQCVTWALFIFAHYAQKQVEAAQFRDMLQETCANLWLMNWEEVETTMFGFLYVPNIMRPSWRKTWDDVELKRSRESKTPKAEFKTA